MVKPVYVQIIPYMFLLVKAKTNEKFFVLKNLEKKCQKMGFLKSASIIESFAYFGHVECRSR